MLPFMNKTEEEKNRSQILLYEQQVEKEKQNKINQNVLQSVEYLKFYGLPENLASQIVNGKIYCADSNGLLQDNTDIFKQYLVPNSAQPRELTELENKILINIPELCQFDKKSGEWKNLNQNFYADFPMFCINIDTKSGKKLSILRYGATRKLSVEREFMDGKTLETSAITVDINNFIMRQDKGNLQYFEETIVIWLDNGRIIRIM